MTPNFNPNKWDREKILDYVIGEQPLTDEQLEFLIYFDKLQRENKELKEKLEENTKIYLHTSKYASEIEGKYVESNYILTEIEKWLEEKIYEKVEPPFKNWEDERIEYYLNRREGFKECLDKLQELKGVVNNE